MNMKGDGCEMQAALKEWTGKSTARNVFIGGKHVFIGGKHIAASDS